MIKAGFCIFLQKNVKMPVEGPELLKVPPISIFSSDFGHFILQI